MSTIKQSFGADGTFTAPATMLGSTVGLDIRGAPGVGGPGGIPGGPGAQVVGSVALSPGDTLTIHVGQYGGAGYTTGGTGGTSGSGIQGGNGGGSSAALNSSAALLAVAAGGGGGAGGPLAILSGAGGFAGSPIGGDGFVGNPTSGTPSGGGPGGGASGATPGLAGGAGTGGSGTAGSAGSSGGNGGNGGSDSSDLGGGGGGGGAGYAGGGGGGAGGTFSTGGGGGGGSSFAQSPFFGANYFGFATTEPNNGVVIVSYTVADAPLKPTNLAPAGNPSLIADFDLGFTASWQYNPDTDSGTQSAYAFKRVHAGTPQWWNATTVAWVGSEVWNTSSVSDVVFPSGNWTTVNSWQVSVATQGSNGVKGPYSDQIILDSEVAITVTVISPGSIVTTPNPTINWVATFGSFGPQTAFRVVTYTQAQTLLAGFVPGVTPPVDDSGSVSSPTTSYSVATTLLNETEYVSYVALVGTPSTHQSLFTPVTYTLVFFAPNVPVLTAVPDVADTGMAIVDLFATQGNDNPLSFQDSTFVGGIGDWAATSPQTITATSVIPTFSGAQLTFCGKLTSTTSGTFTAHTATGLLGVPAAAGGHFSFVASLFPAGAPAGILNGHGNPTPRSFAVGVNWYNLSGTQIGSTVFGSTVTESLTGFTQAVLTNTVAPSGSFTCALVVEVLSCGAPLTTPGAITITHGGTPASTSYSYRVTALNAYGDTLPGSISTTATGPVTLSGTNTNILNWTAVTGATAYRVYRTAGGATQGVIATPTTNTATDTGIVADGTVVPTVNTTAEVHLIIEAAGPYAGSVTTWSPGGFIGNVSVEFEYSDDGGTTWLDVRDGALVHTGVGNQSTLVDYEAPLNAPRDYRARAWAVSQGQMVMSQWASVIPVTLTGDRWWMLDPLNPETAFSFLGQGASPGTAIQFDKADVQGEFQTLGNDTYTIVRGDSIQEEFDLPLLFLDTASWEAFDSLRSSKVTVLIKSAWEGHLFYVALGPARPRQVQDRANMTDPISLCTVHCYPVAIP